MAVISLQSAASALTALNTSMDVTANNLANINTAGFKSSRANFQDLLYQERAQPGAENINGDKRPTGLFVGLGVKVSGTQVDFSQGAPITSNRPLDVMIEGLGFFRVQVQDALAADGIAYTRNGQFTLNADGQLVMVNDQGRRVQPEITVPQDATEVVIDANGQVWARQPGQVELSNVGQIETSVFVNPSGLKQVGENLFVETEASGQPITGEPGVDNRGQLRQGMYEGSNVDPTQELISLIRTQRAFEMNSQTIRAADDTLRAVAQLHR
jgi:flagellar basal-body rod protein FlgG